MEISHAKAREVFDQLQRARHHLRSVREKAEATIGRGKLAVEVLGGAGLAGYLNVRQGVSGQPWQLFGFEADMALGILGVGAALAGVAGRYDEDVLGLALGFGASWANREGAVLAATNTPAAAHQVSGKLPAGQYSGKLPAGQYSGALSAAGHWVSAHQQSGALPAGLYQHGVLRSGQVVYPT